jgi:myo-inositol-1(or 4)-monophosphatase
MYSALIHVMVKAAEKAAKGLKRDFGEVEHLQISRKGPSDFVSVADLKAEKILAEELSRARPEFSMLREEAGESPAAKQGTAPGRWIIDPLDGTTNFLHGLPHWCISIAAEKNGEIVAGVVYAPISDELYWAEKGVGAYQRSKRLRVSARRDMAECLLATGIPFGNNADVMKPHFKDQFARVVPKVAGVRRFGSAALDLAYVAAGRYDGYWEEGLKIWDIAAGVILVKEAGGTVEGMHKNTDPLAGSLIASNGQIHDGLLTIIRGDKP